MYAEIVFPLPFRKPFTYIIPGEFKGFAKPGVRAVAPFGKRILTGFIINITEKTEVTEKLKPIADILDDKPIFSSNDLKFYQWVSDYYLCSLGEALKLGVPYGTEIESKRKIIIDSNECIKLLKEEKNINTVKGKILKILSEREEINLSYLQKLTAKKNIYSILKTLENKGALTILNDIEDAKIKPKKINYVRLTKSAVDVYEAIPEIEHRSPKQVGILLELISQKDKSIPLSKLLKKTGASKASVDSLKQKGFLKIFEKEIDRKYAEDYSERLIEFDLTGRQKNVVDEISPEIENGKFKTFLLYGVTGSGKTQVYIELIKKALELNKTALILVPEISLTPQMTSRLRNNFGELVTVIHSRMSLGERYDSWRRILNRKSKVVIGARSALFSPLKNLGIIVVDEEHDPSFKQFDMIPKYNARDSAIILGNINKVPVILGSATPSIESMYNALNGKYKLLNLPERIDDAKLPKIELVNVTIERKNKQMENIFSKKLLDKIEDRLKKKEGAIILQNRRGFSTQVYCEDCSTMESCINCSVPLVYHINKNILQCHYCGFIKDVPKVCSNCGSLKLKYFGTGTERVEDEIEFYFPNTRIRRIDSDSISKKASLGKILNEFGKGDIDILVGTQMVSKGLDFPRLTLVGVISAETTLWLPDFRADERTFQLLTQVAGRAGRSKVEGEVIIQTQNEHNFTLQRVLHNDYTGFYQKEIEVREKTGYPPFTHICLVETRDLDEVKAKDSLADFYREIFPYKKWLTISKPSAAIISRLKGFYRFQLIIKSFKETDPGGKILRKALLNSFIEFNRKSRYRDVRLYFDIDPQSVM
jgi:primosomal protein N' (replication factor Y) (superfamily II helicase)